MIETEQLVYETKPENVEVLPNRQRQKFDQKKMAILIDSIKELGQKTPGLCRTVEDNLVLVFGERRLRACKALGVPFKYILEEETDPYVLARIEFSENVARDDLTFQEEALAIAKFHEISQDHFGISKVGASGGGHGIKDTAEVAGISATKVAEELEIAQFLELPEVANAKNRTEARKTIKRLKEDYMNAVALEKARSLNKVPEGVTKPVEASDISAEALAEAHLKEKVAFYDPFILNGLMENRLEEFKDGWFDVVCFDPPWGVDYDKVKLENAAQDTYKDDKSIVFEKLPGWLKLIYSKMADNSHLYMFFGMVHHEFVYEQLEKAGFVVNRIPIIWYKQGSHRTRNPDVWPGRSYEPIAFARKGSKNLLKKGAPDMSITPAPWPSLKKSHPSAKHPEIYRDLLVRSCAPGDNVLDPMCGSGMLGVAAETMRTTHQLRWIEIEEKKNFAELALVNVIKGYSALVNKASTEIWEDVPDVE